MPFCGDWNFHISSFPSVDFQWSCAWGIPTFLCAWHGCNIFRVSIKTYLTVTLPLQLFAAYHILMPIFLLANLKLVQLSMTCSQDHVLVTADIAIHSKAWGILLLHCSLLYAVLILMTLVCWFSLKASGKWKCMVFYLLVQDLWHISWKATKIYLKTISSV